MVSTTPALELLPPTLTAMQAAAIRVCSHTHVYQCIRRGEIAVARLGRASQILTVPFLRQLSIDELTAVRLLGVRGWLLEDGQLVQP
jgi:hypothetical protein